MNTRFNDRQDAGRQLAEHLHDYSHRSDLLVLALPGGGIQVAAEVAKALHAPLDIFVVRKIGLPAHPELVMATVTSEGGRILNQRVIDEFGVPGPVVEALVIKERAELVREERALRSNRPTMSVKGRTVILVDDGIATGATMAAAYQALRETDAWEVIVAVPVLSAELFDELQYEHEKILAVMAPEEFRNISEWYLNFDQVSADDVRQILTEFNHNKHAQYV